MLSFFLRIVFFLLLSGFLFSCTIINDFSKKQYKALALIPANSTEIPQKVERIAGQIIEKKQKEEFIDLIDKSKKIASSCEDSKECLIRYSTDASKQSKRLINNLGKKQKTTKIPLQFSADKAKTIDWFSIILAITIIGIMALLAFTNFSSTAWVIILIFVILVLLILIFLIFNMIFGGIFGFMSEIF